MAPPPDSAAEVRSPCWRRAIHRTKGKTGATSARARPANRYQDRHAVSRFSSQARTQARPTVLPYRPQGGGLSPITLSPPLPLSDAGRPIHILPADSARVAAVGLGLCMERRSANTASRDVHVSAKAGQLAAGAYWPRGWALPLLSRNSCWVVGR